MSVPKITQQPDRNPKKKVVRKKIKIGKIIKVFFTLLLIAGFFVGGAIAGLLTSIINATPDVDLSQLRPEGYASVIYDAAGNEIATLNGVEANRFEVDIDDLPAYVGQAYVAIEDERFFEHNGIDLKAILRAFKVNIAQGNFSQGGSTLTQQVIKNNVLTSEKKLARKVQEQYLAISLENRLVKRYGKKGAKRQILEKYLNTINMGKGAYGIQSAAERYFNKNASELSIAESAVLSAITPNPSNLNPVADPEANKKRQVVILKKMWEQGYITEMQYKDALAEDVYGLIKTVAKEFSTSVNSYFVDAVINEVVADLVKEKNLTKTKAFDLLYRGGLRVYTTQDTTIQKTLEKAMLDEANFPEEDFAIRLEYALSVEHADGTVQHFSNPIKPKNPWGTSLFKTKEEADAYIKAFKAEKVKSTDKIIGERPIYIPQPQAAMVITDWQTGEIRGLVGGRGEKKFNRSLNRAIDPKTARQPGSTFKVLASFAPAIDTGKATASSIYDDIPLSIDIGYGKTYEPNNWYRNNRHQYWFKGLSSVRRGIAYSMNIVTIKTLQDVGLDTGFEYLKKFGFTTLISPEDNSQKNDKGYPMALGGLTYGVTPVELNAAYGSIANGGIYQAPILYRKVTQNGNLLLEKKSESHRTLKETSASIVTDMLRTAVSGPEATGRRTAFKDYKMPVAGKTGTTQYNDNLLYAGFTPYYAATVWVGYDLPTYMKNGVFHVNLWRKVMESIHTQKQLPYKKFKLADGLISREICRDSGQLATNACKNDPRGNRVYTEIYTRGTEPTKECTVHYEVELCKDSGLLASPTCPVDSREKKVFIKRPEGKELALEKLDEAMLKRIEDYQYQIPAALIGEYHQEPHVKELPPVPGNLNLIGENGTQLDPSTPVLPPEGTNVEASTNTENTSNNTPNESASPLDALPTP